MGDSNMAKEIVKIKMDEEFKEKALQSIEDTIEKVLTVHNVELKPKEKRSIKNFSLDQLNVNVTNRINSKTLWVFNIESSVPVIVERSKDIPKFGGILPEGKNVGKFTMNTNGSWSLAKKSKKGKGENAEEGLNKKDFEKIVLKMLLEDLETAAFYGTLSYVEVP